MSPRQDVPDHEWRGLGDQALEALLVERWLYRGILLGVVLFAAVVATLLGARGLGGLRDQVLAGALVALSLGLGVVVFFMRQRDLEIHRELRRRRIERSGAQG